MPKIQGPRRIIHIVHIIHNVRKPLKLLGFCPIFLFHFPDRCAKIALHNTKNGLVIFYMSQFRVYRDNSADAVCLSGIFIDEYMTDANDAQLKIYLYLLRILGSGRDCGVSVLADRFNYTEKDVIRALTYWEKKGLLTQEKEDGALVGIRLMDPVSRKEAPSQDPVPAKAPAPAEEKQSSPEPEVRSFQSERSYSADEINEFRSRADTAELLFVVEQYLGYASGSGATCTWHTSWQPAAPSAETSEMIRQAYSLIAAAEEQLLGLDPAGAQYQAVSTAIYDLRAVISQAYPSLEEINTAVTRLTQAMMGFLY